MSEKDNHIINKKFYDKAYKKVSIGTILWKINNLDLFLDKAIKTETSWHGLYMFDFASQLKGKKVLELGCGDCTNAAVMAQLGAEVWANDIADVSGEIINEINKAHNFEKPIKFLHGNFLNNSLEEKSFDIIVGKAFLHHLELEVEQLFLKECARLLKKNGQARFFEPAVNNKLLDEIRWHIPVRGRPSKFDKKAFKLWKNEDPHPDRSFSSQHFKNVGVNSFNRIKIVPVGTLERFSRFFPWGERKNFYKRWALKVENKLPIFINHSFARAQLIIYTKPYHE